MCSVVLAIFKSVLLLAILSGIKYSWVLKWFSDVSFFFNIGLSSVSSFVSIARSDSMIFLRGFGQRPDAYAKSGWLLGSPSKHPSEL